MVAITKRPALLTSLRILDGPAVILAAGLAGIALLLGRESSWWPVALVVVLLTELWFGRRKWSTKSGDGLMMLAIPLVVGLAAVLVITLNIRFASQIGMAVSYGVWRWLWAKRHDQAWQLGHLLLAQAMWFEALFLAAAVWRAPDWLVLGLVWLGAYLAVYGVLRARGERTAGILAAAWALVTVEVSWVLLMWLFTYTGPGGYILVPQPALVLVALAYCYGSIYASARTSNLSRGRLWEYLAIGLIVIVMVISGTSWKGSI